jgi:hypothetical protein
VTQELATAGEPPADTPACRPSGPLGAIQAADREIARQTALRARAVAEFAAARPASVDRQPGQLGCMSAERRAARPEVLAEVSEWAAQELVVALSISSAAAEALLTRSLTLVHRLPATLAALEAGALHCGHLWPMLEKVAPIANPGVRRQVESALLAWAAGRVTTPAQLGAKARRLVLARDARGAAQRLTAALRRRGVTVRGDDVDGMAAVTVLATVPEAQALRDALGRYADALDDEPGQPPRTRGQKMVDCLLDLVLRPGETDLAPVQAQWTVVAGVATLAGGDEPGEIGGEPVPAEMIRSLARAFGLLPDITFADPVTGPADPDPDPATGPAFADSDVEQRELERWWTEVEERVLAEEWGGSEAPPPDELAAYWAQEARWENLPDDGPPDPGEPVVPPDPAGPVDPPDPGDLTAPADDGMPSGWWAAADAAVDELSGAMWEVDVALGRARRAVERAQIADAADERAWEQGAAGRVPAGGDAIAALTQASAERRAALRDLIDATAGGGLVDRPRIAVTDALTGTLLALTDSRELRRRSACPAPACRRDPARCTHDLAGLPGLGPPPDTPGYRPGAALDRFLRARDRRCRFPGCRNRVPRGGELDHDRPWPDGPTSAGNLTGYCTGHHRGKHQAPGWQHALAPDGTLTVTTPTGLVATTTPPPY